jgi:RNA-binding protein 39
LEDDVRKECDEKYGRVVHLSLVPNSQGEIYVKFEDPSAGESAVKSLDGRFFGGRQISARSVAEDIYSMR